MGPNLALKVRRSGTDPYVGIRSASRKGSPLRTNAPGT